MKPTWDIPPALLDNAAHFQSAFFQRATQRDHTVHLTESLAKTYAFPTFYADVTCAMAIFLCDYQAARAILPHPSMKPVRMPRGKALALVSCYNYRNVQGIPGYHEIAMTIPVLVGPGRDWPILPLLADGLFPHMGYYVFGMPVTSKENQLRGNRIWGLPKVTQEIEQFEDGTDCVTIAREDDGTPYFTLRVPMTGAPTHFDMAGWIYSQLDGRLLRARTAFEGMFNVHKHLGTLLRPGNAPQSPPLTLGDGPSARLLRQLQLEPQPFQTRFAKTMQASFDLPQADWRAPC